MAAEEAGEPEDVGRLCSSFLPTEQDRRPCSQRGGSELPSVANFPSGGVAPGLSQGLLPHEYNPKLRQESATLASCSIDAKCSEAISGTVGESTFC